MEARSTNLFGICLLWVVRGYFPCPACSEHASKTLQLQRSTAQLRVQALSTNCDFSSSDVPWQHGPSQPRSNSMSQMTQEQQLEQAVLLPQLLQAQTEPTSHTALIQPTPPHFPRRIQSGKNSFHASQYPISSYSKLEVRHNRNYIFILNISSLKSASSKAEAKTVSESYH